MKKKPEIEKFEFSEYYVKLDGIVWQIIKTPYKEIPTVTFKPNEKKA